jgi:flagellar motor component MotA
VNLKKVLGILAAIGAPIGIALAHNIDSIIANPGSIVGIILGVIGAAVLGHDAGTKSGEVKGQETILTKLPEPQAAALRDLSSK